MNNNFNFLKVDKSDLNIISNITPKNNKNEKINYSKKVCLKPWGYEFLCYETNKIGIWFLKINMNNKTSVHVHFKKDTIMLVLSGKVKLNFVDDFQIFETMDLIYIPKKKFHGIEPISEYCYLLEIEIFDLETTFSDKNDLFRLIDGYVRDKDTYQGSIQMIENNLEKYNYFEIEKDLSTYLDDTLIEYNSNFSSNSENYFYILLDGEFTHNYKIYKEGSIFSQFEYSNLKLDDKSLFLKVSNNYLEKNKIINNLEELKYIKQKYNNDKLILTSGCFDILHIGHLKILKEAKKLGDKLIVCLSKDEQIKFLKGEDRPINNNKDRLNLFITISYVDYVFLYDENLDNELEEKLDEIMNIVNPYYWVKGNDYDEIEIRKKHPNLNNIKLIDLVRDKSTTKIIKKIRDTDKNR